MVEKKINTEAAPWLIKIKLFFSPMFFYQRNRCCLRQQNTVLCEGVASVATVSV